ncbi:hypothetical protein RCL_jg27171.t1 [Rhizophagus clarus]|uniref:Uncharacterized protein n=1 Tax=Rhizophagus clarus TaxID=94130 RepID=A0A8H3LYY5_9GLOM|nr:hypothetical protein RCL_jg27171.t1 [Rhizophagus clarus]
MCYLILQIQSSEQRFYLIELLIKHLDSSIIKTYISVNYSFEISGILALIKTCREPLLYLTYLSWTCTYQVFQNLSII